MRLVDPESGRSNSPISLYQNSKRWDLGLRLSHVILSDTSPTRLAHRTGSCKRKKTLANSTKLQPKEKNTPFCYPHGLPRFATSRLSLAHLHHQGHTSITMESSSKAPVKLVKVTRVLGRTGMKRPLSVALAFPLASPLPSPPLQLLSPLSLDCSHGKMEEKFSNFKF